MGQLTLRSGALIALCTVWMLGTDTLGVPIVADFEDLALSADSVAPADATETPFVNQGVTFNRTWNHQFDCCPSAWAYSNRTDLTTAGFANSYSAYVLPNGGGYGGSANFAVANDTDVDDAVVTMPRPSRVEGMYVTNVTYAFLAVVDGDDCAGFVKGPFVDGDWFKLNIIGTNGRGEETGRVGFYLADYRDGQSAAVADWTWVDLTPLGENVSALGFELSSTDNSMFGMNTPSFFAIDDLTFVPVPEPTSLLLAFFAAMMTASQLSRRRLRDA